MIQVHGIPALLGQPEKQTRRCLLQSEAEKDDVASQRMEAAREWIEVCKVDSTLDRRMYRAKLHEGEVEVMLLAQEIGADAVIIDDGAARINQELLCSETEANMEWSIVCFL